MSEKQSTTSGLASNVRPGNIKVPTQLQAKTNSQASQPVNQTSKPINKTQETNQNQKITSQNVTTQQNVNQPDPLDITSKRPIQQTQPQQNKNVAVTQAQNVNESAQQAPKQPDVTQTKTASSESSQTRTIPPSESTQPIMPPDSQDMNLSNQDIPIEENVRYQDDFNTYDPDSGSGIGAALDKSAFWILVGAGGISFIIYLLMRVI